MKHKLLFSLIVLQTLVAIMVSLSFYILLWPFELLLSFTPLVVSLLIIGLAISIIMVCIKKRVRGIWPGLTIALIGLVASFYSLYFSLTAQFPNRLIKTNQPTIIFTTFNKLYSNNDLAKAAEYFDAQNVDILAVQESQSGEVDELRQKLGFEHSYITDRMRSARGTVVGVVS